MDLKTIGVVGAGIMGSGVAQNLAETGHQVILTDISNETLEKSGQEILKNIRFQILFGKNKEAAAPDEIMELIHFTVDSNKLHDVQYVIENVTEKWAVKKKVYQEMDRICPTRSGFCLQYVSDTYYPDRSSYFQAL